MSKSRRDPNWDHHSIMAEVRRRGVAWVDVTSLSRQQGDRVVDDGLHPTAQAYAAWTDRIEPTVHAALTDAPPRR